MNVWRDRLGRWLTPLARRSPLAPNTITLLALGLNLGAAVCLFFGARRPLLFVGAVVLLGIGGLADGLDGVVARVQNKASRFGDFLDHFADRVSDSLLIASWMIGSGVRTELTVATTIVVMLNGYIGTQIEATYGERSYDSVGRGEFVLALVIYPIVSYILFSNGWETVSAAGLRIAEWMTVVLAALGVLGIGQRIALAARLGRSER